MADYRDPNNIDPNGNFSITQLVKFIREKMFGIDVRESIAKALEKVYEDASKDGNANMEVSQARGSYETLNDRLDESDNDLVKKANTNMVEAYRDYLDNKIENLFSGMGEPFASYDQLIAAYPNGDSKSHVVTDDNKWYFWSSVAKSWTAGGSFEKTQVSDKSIINSNLSLPFNLLPDTPSFVFGGISSVTGGVTSGKTRIVSDIIHVANSEINLANPIISYTIAYYNADGSYDRTLSWRKNPTPLTNVYVRIMARYDNDAVIGNVGDVSKWIYLKSDDNAISKSESDRLYISKKDYGNPLLDFVIGQATSNGNSNDLRRCRTKDAIAVVDGATVKVKDTATTDLSWVRVDENGGYLAQSMGWLDRDQLTAGLYYFNQRYEDNRNVVDFDYFKTNFVLDNKNDIVTTRTLGELSPNKISYVSPSGNDNNLGNSKLSAFKTLQKALDEGATMVFCERGIYENQTVTAQFNELTILPYGGVTPTGDQTLQKIEFIGSDKLPNEWEDYESIKRQPYTNSNELFKKVFIDKTVVPDSGGPRPSYNACVWDVSNGINDVKLKPVLTIDACVAETGTFFYDGSYIYVNVDDVSHDFYAVKLMNGINFSGGKLTMVDVVADYYQNNPMDLDNVDSVDGRGCEASHSVLNDGFSLDKTNGRLEKCKAIKNRNDGYNFHAYGNTTLVDCVGSDNYDDGASHHDKCIGVVVGGEFARNGKGGVSPVTGAQVSVYNAVLLDNDYAIYNVDQEGVTTKTSGNLIKGNRVGIANEGGKIISINDKFVDNTTDVQGSGTTERY